MDYVVSIKFEPLTKWIKLYYTDYDIAINVDTEDFDMFINYLIKND